MTTVPCQSFMSLLNHTSHSGSREVTAAASQGHAASQSSSTSATPVWSKSGTSQPLKQPWAPTAGWLVCSRELKCSQYQSGHLFRVALHMVQHALHRQT